MTDKDRQTIEDANVEQLLSWVRFTKPGQGWFADRETGEYVMQTLSRKRDQDPDEFVRASKYLGW